MTDRVVLHPGPPTPWEEMPRTLQTTVMGALMFEGRATSLEEAKQLVDAREVELGSAHDHASTCPGTEAIVPSLPRVRRRESPRRESGHLRASRHRVRLRGLRAPDDLEAQLAG